MVQAVHEWCRRDGKKGGVSMLLQTQPLQPHCLLFHPEPSTENMLLIMVWWTTYWILGMFLQICWSIKLENKNQMRWTGLKVIEQKKKRAQSNAGTSKSLDTAGHITPTLSSSRVDQLNSPFYQCKELLV